MPDVPSVLFAQGFRGKTPKLAINAVRARAVGGVCGIYNLTSEAIDTLMVEIGKTDLRKYLVSYASGFYKLEINQINALLNSLLPTENESS